MADVTSVQLLDRIVAIAHEAGDAVMSIYSQSHIETTYKNGNSPLTRADMASHDLIMERLCALIPQMPVLSEESKTVPYDERRAWQTFWLVDPLDGTKEFIKRNGEFTVNIALIAGGRPVMGVVRAPAMDVSYFAAQGIGAFKRNSQRETKPIAVTRADPERLNVVVSRSHGNDQLERFLDRIGPYACLEMGSSLKLCLVAEGAADLYPRLGPTMEWDTAAAQCIVETAGGKVTDLSGRRLQYNKPDLHNPDFIVSGLPDFSCQSYFSSPQGAA